MVNLMKAGGIILRLVNESPNLWRENIRKQYKAYKNITIIFLKNH